MSEMGMAMMGSGIGRGDDRALAAAEAAIKNPLLEDINLAGACGILVNITAGPNLTMREFEEIGSTVQELASDDATIVIGTALDPEIQDDIRVTVVATGLNRGQVAARVNSDRRDTVVVERAVERPIRVVRNATTGAVEYPMTGSGFRSSGGRGSSGAVAESAGGAPTGGPDDYLDIPAFLRRQAD